MIASCTNKQIKAFFPFFSQTNFCGDKKSDNKSLYIGSNSALHPVNMM